MNLYLPILVKKGIEWDSILPDELRPIWISHFEMMQEICRIKFQRAVDPEDAINPDIETIDAADASLKLAFMVIYTRFI